MMNGAREDCEWDRPRFDEAHRAKIKKEKPRMARIASMMNPPVLSVFIGVIRGLTSAKSAYDV
jgi:hypothetical protein